MIKNTRTWTTTLLIPLMFKDKSIISKTTYRFVNAYLADFNRPYITKKLLLVYESPIGIPLLNQLEEKLKTHPLYFSQYGIRIGGIFYHVFTFDIDACLEYKKDIYSLIDYNNKDVSYVTKLKILKYWGVPLDSNEHSYLFNPISPTVETVKFAEEIIPEEDLNQLEGSLDLMNYGV